MDSHWLKVFDRREVIFKTQPLYNPINCRVELGNPRVGSITLSMNKRNKAKVDMGENKKDN